MIEREEGESGLMSLILNLYDIYDTKKRHPNKIEIIKFKTKKEHRRTPMNVHLFRLLLPTLYISHLLVLFAL